MKAITNFINAWLFIAAISCCLGLFIGLTARIAYNVFNMLG